MSSRHRAEDALGCSGRGGAVIAKHILLVDDTVDLTRLMRIILEEDRHKVSVLDTGHGVQEYVRANPPDLIVLDLRLGDISGMTVLHDLKADPETAGIPVVVYTASVVDAEKTQKMIANDPGTYDGTRVLQKPFDLDELLRVFE